MAEPGWVVARVQVSQGDVDFVSAEARFESRAEAEGALANYRDEGHAWSGLTAYRVLWEQAPGVFLCDDRQTAYYPKQEYGF